MKSVIHLLPRVLQVTGVLMLGYVLFHFVRVQDFQARERLEFDRASRTNQSISQSIEQTGIKRAFPKLDAVIGRIDIPRLQISTMVLEGAEERELELGAGHVPGTGLPGESANIVIAAHRDTFFRPLKKVVKNDRIVLTTLRGSFHYIVDSVEITAPENTTVMQTSGESELTLVTCYPFYFVGPAPERFIVHARGIEPDSLR